MMVILILISFRGNTPIFNFSCLCFMHKLHVHVYPDCIQPTTEPQNCLHRCYLHCPLKAPFLHYSFLHYSFLQRWIHITHASTTNPTPTSQRWHQTPKHHPITAILTFTSYSSTLYATTNLYWWSLEVPSLICLHAGNRPLASYCITHSIQSPIIYSQLFGRVRSFMPRDPVHPGIFTPRLIHPPLGCRRSPRQVKSIPFHCKHQ